MNYGLNNNKSLIQCAFLFCFVCLDSPLSQGQYGHQTNSRSFQVQRHLFSDCLFTH